MKIKMKSMKVVEKSSAIGPTKPYVYYPNVRLTEKMFPLVKELDGKDEVQFIFTGKVREISYPKEGDENGEMSVSIDLLKGAMIPEEKPKTTEQAFMKAAGKEKLS